MSLLKCYYWCNSPQIKINQSQIKVQVHISLPICVFFSLNFTFLGSILIKLTSVGKLSWHPLVGLWCIPLFSVFLNDQVLSLCKDTYVVIFPPLLLSAVWIRDQPRGERQRDQLCEYLVRCIVDAIVSDWTCCWLFFPPLSAFCSPVVPSQWLLQFLTVWTSLVLRVLTADQFHVLLYHYMSVYAHMPLFYSWFISLYSSISYSCRVYIKGSAILSL